ncbi:MAG: M48 family metalloprotease [Marinobacter sp.]|nr:M48 family metalloprotease [Marinobacter sp.]
MNDKSVFDGLERNLRSGRINRRQMLGLMAVAGGGMLVGCSANPVTGQRQFTLMTPSQEVAIDQQHAPGQLSADYGITQDRPLRQYVEGVGKTIGDASHRPGMPYSYNPVNANYVNAYAFPGGTIGVTRGILLAMDSEAELAALLGHEVAHVSARHTAQRMSTQTLTGIAVAGVGLILATQMDSDRAALAMGLGGLAAGALLARYSRSDERQADSLGMEYMHKANQNPQGMVALMDMLRSTSSRQPNMIEQMFSSHPMSGERYDNMVQEARQKYAASANRNLFRERYMDNTANLRRLKPAIDKQQEAESALMAKRLVDGDRLLQEALRLAPEDYTGLVLMAKAKIMQEDLQAAIPYLDRAIAVYPEEAQAQQLRGAIETKLGHWEEALEHFSRYARINPDNVNNAFFLALCHEALGNNLRAKLAYADFLSQPVAGPTADYARQRLLA